jgi:hypothetical protein
MYHCFIPFCVCVCDWDLNSGLGAGKVGILLLEPHLPSILLWLFWKWGLARLSAQLASHLFLLISASQVVRITLLLILFFFFLQYWGVNAGPIPRSTPAALFCGGFFSR